MSTTLLVERFLCINLPYFLHLHQCSRTLELHFDGPESEIGQAMICIFWPDAVQPKNSCQERVNEPGMPLKRTYLTINPVL